MGLGGHNMPRSIFMNNPKTKNYLAEYGHNLIRNGYSIIPICRGQKYPPFKAWQKYQNTSHQQIQEWSNIYPSAGIGILTYNTPSIDIDVWNPDYVQELVKDISHFFGQEIVLTRTGQSPKILIPCWTDTPFSKLASDIFIDADGRKNQVEILGDGQQFVAMGIHPDTQQLYRWTSPERLISDNKQAVLPFLNEEKVRELLSDIFRNRPGEWNPIKGNINPKTRECIDVGEKTQICPLQASINGNDEQIIELLKHLDSENYENWIRVGMALEHEYKGNSKGLIIWNNWSAEAVNYDEAIMDNKWQSFKSENKKNPVTKATIVKLVNEAKQVQEKTRIKDFYERYVLIGGSHVLDLKRDKHKELMKLTDFKSYHKDFHILVTDVKEGKVKTRCVSEEWHRSDRKKKAEGLIYRPSDKDFITDRDGGIYYNTFYFPKHKKPQFEIDTSVFYEHINFLFPVESEAKWFIDWIAFSIQHPELRSPIAPLHISIHQGTGRGWLVKLIVKILGEHNITKTDVDAFSDTGSKSQFNGYLHNSLLCVIEELKQSSKRHFALADRIKSVITDEYQSFNLKGKPEFTDRCYTNMFFMSNHKDAIVLRPSDRRLNVFHFDGEPKEESYYIKLYKWLDDDDNISGLFFELKERQLDVEGFQGQKVIENSAREITIEDTKSDTDIAFDDFMDEPPAAWMTIWQIHCAVSRLADVNVSIEQITKIIQKHQKVRHRKRIKIDKKVQRLWCLDNQYKDLSNEDIKAIFKKTDERLKSPHSRDTF